MKRFFHPAGGNAFVKFRVQDVLQHAAFFVLFASQMGKARFLQKPLHLYIGFVRQTLLLCLEKLARYLLVQHPQRFMRLAQRHPRAFHRPQERQVNFISVFEFAFDQRL